MMYIIHFSHTFTLLFFRTLDSQTLPRRRNREKVGKPSLRIPST